MPVVALVVFLSDVVARFAFGRSGLFGAPGEEGQSRFVPQGEHVWVEYQQDWLQAAGLGLGSGMFSSFLALSILETNPDATLAAITAGFGISAATLLFLALGAEFPVTHHMTISAAYVAVASGNILLGIVAGIVAALVGEVLAEPAGMEPPTTAGASHWRPAPTPRCRAPARACARSG